MDMTARIFDNLKILQDIVRFIDTKASVLLVVDGVFITAFLKISDGLTFVGVQGAINFQNSFASFCPFVFGCIFASVFLCQVYVIVFKVIVPRSACGYHGSEKSLVYFGHICSMKRHEFKECYCRLNEEDLIQHLLDQIHEISGIINVKTEWLKMAMRGLYVMIVFLSLFYVSSIYLGGVYVN